MIELTPGFRSDLLDWLRTGAFRGVRLGMTRAECIEKLGVPENWAEGLGGDQLSDAGLYVWEPLEFRFEAWRKTSDHSLDKLIRISSTGWKDHISALFGYGYDTSRNVYKNKLMKILEEIDRKSTPTKYTGIHPFEEERILLFAGQDHFQFIFIGDSGNERILGIQQDYDIPTSFYNLSKLS